MNKAVRFLLCYLGGMLFIMPFWISGTFGGGVTVEQMLFHLLSGSEGVIGTDSAVKTSFILFNLVAPFLFPLLLAAGQWQTSRITADEKQKKIDKAVGRACLIFFVAGTATFSWKINLYQYIRSRFGEDTFSGLYADPAKIHFKSPARKKNLILIYVESLECDLAHIGPRRIDAISPIEELPGYHVKNFMQAPGTGWSIAGMISSQAGIPVKPFYYNDEGNFMGKKVQQGYYPNLVSFGDILAKDGYIQYFLVGPDLKFSGMDKFYFKHGCNRGIGRDEWLSFGLDRKSFTGWGSGLHDDDLLDQAYRIIAENRLKNRPFAVTIMTADTHFPDGYPSPKCNKDEANESFIGAFRYTSRCLAGFVNRLISEGILKDTDIVIMGDHLFMASDSQLKDYFSNDRRVYFKIITANKRKPNRETMTHFDVAPTILDLLGKIKNSDTKYGLGISLFSHISPVEYDRHLRQVMSEDILSPSIVYDQFWNSRSQARK